MKTKFLSRKFFLTCAIVCIASFKLDGGDLMGVLIACISAYSLANAGEYFASKNKD